MLTVPEMADFWDNYLRDSADERDPLARPLLADLTGMPPTFLCVAECDILADENREMAERLKAAGVEVEAQIYRGATHSFLEAVQIAPLADRALADAAAWLRATLKLEEQSARS
jgi:acetyl esterase